MQLDHFVIAVSDWERSNAFYKDVLGAELVEQSPGRWAYRFGQQQLNVHGPGVEPGQCRADPRPARQQRPLLRLARADQAAAAVSVCKERQLCD